MKNKPTILSLIFAILCIGLLIYALFGSEDLYLNRWLSTLGLQPVILALQEFISHYSFPLWILYSVPDGLWMMAFVLSVLMVWNFKIDHRSKPWIYSAIGVGIFFEIGQAMHVVPGTFDFIDLLALCAGAAVPYFFTLLKPRVCEIN